MKIGMIQMLPTKDPQENINIAIEKIRECKKLEADIAVLPEMFFCEYNTTVMKEKAIPITSDYVSQLSNIAKEEHIFLVAGSIPEKVVSSTDNNIEHIYNTSIVFNNKGEIIATHRKVKLFDIDVENGQRFKESDIFTAGLSPTVFGTPFGKFGLLICFDVRFFELSRQLTLQGVDGIIVPASFNMTTGPAHWETLFKSRALDNQIFICGVSPARDVNGSYVSYGNSISVDPWGQIIDKADEKPTTLITNWEIELFKKKNIRQQLPVLLTTKGEDYLNISKFYENN